MNKLKNLEFADKVLKDLGISQTHIGIMQDQYGGLMDQYIIMSDAGYKVIESRYDMDEIIYIQQKYGNKIYIDLYGGYLKIYFNN